jgi:CheY-like chemotaxis protein
MHKSNGEDGMSAVCILHVDDESDIREVVEISLGLDPMFMVRSCASGGEAIAAAAEWSPDLILLDVMMPDMDGPMTLARLRECPRTALVPVVFMTARAQAGELRRFLALGAVGVISKPFDPMMLAAHVRRYIAGKEDLRFDTAPEFKGPSAPSGGQHPQRSSGQMLRTP